MRKSQILPLSHEIAPVDPTPRPNAPLPLPGSTKLWMHSIETISYRNILSAIIIQGSVVEQGTPSQRRGPRSAGVGCGGCDWSARIRTACLRAKNVRFLHFLSWRCWHAARQDGLYSLARVALFCMRPRLAWSGLCFAILLSLYSSGDWHWLFLLAKLSLARLGRLLRFPGF